MLALQCELWRTPVEGLRRASRTAEAKLGAASATHSERSSNAVVRHFHCRLQPASYNQGTCFAQAQKQGGSRQNDASRSAPRARERATLNNATLPGRAAVSVPTLSQPQDVYTWLLRALLATPDSDPKPHSEPDAVGASVLSYVLLLIGRKWARMDAAAVLGCLPDTVTLREMSSSVAAMSTGMMRRSHGCKLQACPPAPLCFCVQSYRLALTRVAACG